MDHRQIAAALHVADKENRQISPITVSEPALNLADAYAIQLAGVDLKKAEGHKVVGMKIGLTSRAMQEMFEVNEPDYGHLTDRMIIREGEGCSLSRISQPKVEGELAFILKAPLKGPGLSLADVYQATAFVCPALEIIGSRVGGGKLTLLDSVADNGSAGAFVLGGRLTPIEQVDLRLLGMILEKNGRLVNSGCGAEVMGHPAAAVAWLANKLAEFDISLKAGHIILSGALTAAQPAAAGDAFSAIFAGLGSASVFFAD